MTDQAMREMTPEEIGAADAGCGADRLTQIVRAAEARGYQRGRRALEGAVTHFESAYRSAYGVRERLKATHPLPDPGMSLAEYIEDGFASAEIMARIGYEEWFGKDFGRAVMEGK